MANKNKKVQKKAVQKKPVQKKAASKKTVVKTTAPKKKMLTKSTAKNKTVKKPVIKKSTPKKTVKTKGVVKTRTSAKKTVKKQVTQTKAQVAKKTNSIKTKPTAIKKMSASAQPVVAQIDYTQVITPLGDRLVVRSVNNGERVTAGGLIIPDTVSQATGFIKAEVLAIGSGALSKKGHLKPLDVQVGDQILFSEYAGTKIKFGSEELQIIHETDVMGVVEN